MVAQCVFTGKIKCLDGDTSEIVAELDYGPISRTVTAKAWTDGTSNPLADLKAAQRLVSGANGYNADLIVMGNYAGDAFESNPNVMEAYNKLAISSGQIDPKQLADYGVVQLGTWRGIPLYVSEEQCEDTDGTMKYYVPPKEVLVAASGVQSTMAFAAVAQVNAEGTGMEPIEGRRIPLVFWDKEEDYRRARLSSRPTPVPSNVSNWSVLQVLA
jgi:hypothetical protein